MTPGSAKKAPLLLIGCWIVLEKATQKIKKINGKIKQSKKLNHDLTWYLNSNFKTAII